MVVAPPPSPSPEREPEDREDQEDEYEKANREEEERSVVVRPGSEVSKDSGEGQESKDQPQQQERKDACKDPPEEATPFLSRVVEQSEHFFSLQ